MSRPKLESIPITDALKAYDLDWYSKHSMPGDDKRLASIRQVGLDNVPPIKVKRYSDGEIKILDGHHRLRVAIEDGHRTILANIIKDCDYKRSGL